MVCFVHIDRLSAFIQNMHQKQVLSHSIHLQQGDNFQRTLGWVMESLNPEFAPHGKNESSNTDTVFDRTGLAEAVLQTLL